MRVCVASLNTLPFEDQTISIFLWFGQGVYIFEERAETIQDVLGDVYFPGQYFFNREKCESLDDYATTPRPTYGCGKCGVWLFVHEVPFRLQEHGKMTKTDKTRIFLTEKVNLVPNNC